VKRNTACNLFSYHRCWALGGIAAILMVGVVNFLGPQYIHSARINKVLAGAVSASAILVLSFVSFFTANYYPLVKTKTYKVVLITALLVSFSAGFAAHSNDFELFNDSVGYSRSYWENKTCRPPGYYTFISLFTNTNTLFSSIPHEKNAEQFIKITRAQTVVLLGAWLVFCVVLMSLFPPPLVAALFLGAMCLYNTKPIELRMSFRYILTALVYAISIASMFYQSRIDKKRAMMFYLVVIPLVFSLFYLVSHVSFFSEHRYSILSEALAQTFLVLVIASLVSFYYRGWGVMLPVTAIFCSLMYQTRPAAIYVFVMLGIMIIKALTSDRLRYAPWAAAAVMLCMLIVMGPSAYRHYFGKSRVKFKTPSHIAWSKVAFALQIAEPEDIKYIKNEQARHFFKLAMEKKTKDLTPEPGGKYKWQWMYISPNLYKVAYPLSGGYDMEQTELFSEAGTPILKHRFFRYAGIVVETFGYAMLRSRLNSTIPVWLLLFLSLILMVWLKGAHAMTAGTLIAGHLAHYIIVAIFTEPIPRFLNASEVMVIISIFILTTAATYKTFGGATVKC